MKPEDRKRLKQHIEMIVEHKEPAQSQAEKILRDAIEEQIKGKLELEDKNRKLRCELYTLRFKESQEQRFIWWIWNVYSKNVQELLLELEKTTFPVTPFGMSALVKHIKEGTNGIYDGTYLDIEISTGVKNTNPDYYKDEIKVLLDDLIRDARDYEEALNIGRGMIDTVKGFIARHEG